MCVLRTVDGNDRCVYCGLLMEVTDVCVLWTVDGNDCVLYTVGGSDRCVYCGLLMEMTVYCIQLVEMTDVCTVDC